MYVLPLLMSKLSKQMDQMAMFPYFPYENDKPMSKLVGGLYRRDADPPHGFPQFDAPPDARFAFGAARWFQGDEVRKSCNKKPEIEITPTKKNIACFSWSGFSSHAMVKISVCFWCRRYLEAKIWGDLLGFAIATSGYISQWTDQPCPLGRMHQRLPCLGKRWQTRSGWEERTRDLGISWGLGEEICSQRWSWWLRQHVVLLTVNILF